MQRLPDFIRENTEAILSEWETFARSLSSGGEMDIVALRDHAKAMLDIVARDLEQPQTAQAQARKARGESDAGERGRPTAAQEHGTGRAGSGFTVEQMVSEFRALRASVTRLWRAQQEEIAVTDVDDLIRFDEAIDQAIAESVERFSEAVDRTQERFLAILSHDLRTPLGAIMMSSRFMLDTGELGEPHRTLVARMASSARRMNQMVLDLVEFTRTRFGDAIPIARAEMDVGKLVHDVVQEIGATYPSSEVRVRTSGDLHGEWDYERLAQALVNLVGNAVQHGAPRTPVGLTAEGLEDEVVLSVHNEGPVIPPDEVARIFEAGTRGGDGTRDRRHSGLGLYIVDRIVSGHGGTISVRSSSPEGTTFAVRLPRHAKPPAPPAADRRKQ